MAGWEAAQAVVMEVAMAVGWVWGKEVVQAAGCSTDGHRSTSTITSTQHWHGDPSHMRWVAQCSQ